VSEVDEEGEVMEREKRQEELEGLESQRRTLEGEIEFIEDTRKEIVSEVVEEVFHLKNSVLKHRPEE
jgi:RecJ-like exonuclease